jgi:hypothetical protein
MGTNPSEPEILSVPICTILEHPDSVIDSEPEVFFSQDGHIFLPDHLQRPRQLLHFLNGILTYGLCCTYAAMGNFIDAHDCQIIAECAVNRFYFSHTLLLPHGDAAKSIAASKSR